MFTDALKSYDGLAEYTHKVVDHAERYVDGNVHTNPYGELLEPPEAHY